MTVKLTQYSKASGCGCKIAPAVLEEIIKGSTAQAFESLWVGNETRDDAAVYGFNEETGMISTTDFFTPIVDDPYDFGRISAANAISDVYAMGGKPLMALAILGWPVDQLPANIASEVIKGAQLVCQQAGIPLAGGHSVDTQEPLFGLAVTGIVKKNNIKRNNTIRENDHLYLTKPLGIGILGTALKRGLLSENGYREMINYSTQLNSIGEKLGELSFVHAMTDVTGFGLIGHLLEMLNNTPFSAILHKQDIPIIEEAKIVSKQFVFPDNTTRNYNAQASYVEGMTDLDFILYCDPQTSGGLLVSVSEDKTDEIESLFKNHQQYFKKIGQVVTGKSNKIFFI